MKKVMVFLMCSLMSQVALAETFNEYALSTAKDLAAGYQEKTDGKVMALELVDSFITTNLVPNTKNKKAYFFVKYNYTNLNTSISCAGTIQAFQANGKYWGSGVDAQCEKQQ